MRHQDLVERVAHLMNALGIPTEDESRRQLLVNALTNVRDEALRDAHMVHGDRALLGGLR